MKFIKEFLSDPLGWFFIYLLVGIITFGHAYNNAPDGYYSRWEPKVYIQYGAVEKSFEATFAAAAWPLYVSVQLQKKEEK